MSNARPRRPLKRASEHSPTRVEAVVKRSRRVSQRDGGFIVPRSELPDELWIEGPHFESARKAVIDSYYKELLEVGKRLTNGSYFEDGLALDWVFETSFSDWGGIGQRSKMPNPSDSGQEQSERQPNEAESSSRPTLPPIVAVHLVNQDTHVLPSEYETQSDSEILDESQQSQATSNFSSDAASSPRGSPQPQQTQRAPPARIDPPGIIIITDSDEEIVPAPRPNRNLANRAPHSRVASRRYPSVSPPGSAPESSQLSSRTVRPLNRSANSDTAPRSEVRTRNRTRNVYVPPAAPSSTPTQPTHLWEPRDTVILPKTSFGKARRLLCPLDRAQPIVCVSLRGDVQFISQGTPPVRRTDWSLPIDPILHKNQKVEDAILLQSGSVIMGYDNSITQIGILTRPQDESVPQVTYLKSTHSGCITSLCPIGPQKFASGGNDRHVQLWTLNASGLPTSTDMIHVDQSAAIAALAHQNRLNHLISAAGTRIAVNDLGVNKVLSRKAISNSLIHQLHVNPDNPNFILVETADLYEQFLVFDQRIGFHSPEIKFGIRNEPAKTRYSKGSFAASLFVHGYADGNVRVWDIREGAKLLKVVATESRNACHAILQGNQIIVSGGHIVTFLE